MIIIIIIIIIGSYHYHRICFKAVANAPMPVMADMNIKVLVNLKLQRREYTCYSYIYFDTSDVSNDSYFT